MKNFDWKKNGFKLIFTILCILGGIWILSSMFVNVKFYGINVERITRTISYVTIGLLLVTFIYSIYQIKTLKITRKILYGLSCLLMVGIIMLNNILPGFAPAINRFLGVKKYDIALAQEYRTEAEELTAEIEAEGIVMLENKNNTLPLKNQNINVFGYASNAVIYGGTGSGGGAEGDNVSLYAGLEEAGFSVNKDLVKFYEDHFVPRESLNIHQLNGGDFNIKEPALTEYGTLLEDAKSFSDTAVVVFQRHSGEGADLPIDTSEYIGGEKGVHYLELEKNEKELLNAVKESYDKVVVLINSTNQMELGFLEDEKVDAALWIGYPGSTGFQAVAKALNGTVNPSGRLTNTYAYEIESAPTYYNTGEFEYTNSEFEYGKNTWHYKYLDYQEGIYVGYRYYETRFVDNNTGQIDEAAYNQVVQYPFGYGLSYTNFTQSIENYQATSETISMDVKVTNTGNVAGKDVAQMYYTAPYTVGGLEKAHVVLADFAKTEMLAPGESQTVKLTVAVEDMTSYDQKNEQAYVLEAGDYQIKLMNNSHEVLDSRIYNVTNKIVYNENNKRKTDEIVATNQFDDIIGDVVYLSRADWEGTFPKEIAQNKEASAELLEAIKNDEIKVDESAEAIIFKDNGLTLADMKGLDYDDPKWEQLLQQLSVNDMKKLITAGGFLTVTIDSIKKPATVDTDGPAGVNDIFARLAGNQYTSEVVLASTWNVDLAKRMGQQMAKEAQALNMTGLYMPGINLHRSPLGGRNFEYFSEDPILSAHIGGSAIQGVSDQGLYAYVKHFAMYDTETKRYEFPTGATVWANEQSMREVYLKPFEVTIKNYEVTGVMSSYNRVGPTWVGASKELMQTVLRDEWGFDGVVISDFYKPQYMNGDAGLAAGNDLILFPMATDLSDETLKTNWGHQNLRKASHNVLYAIANSTAYESAQRSVPSWIFIFLGFDALMVAFIGSSLLRTTKSKKMLKRKEEQL